MDKKQKVTSNNKNNIHKYSQSEQFNICQNLKQLANQKLTLVKVKPDKANPNSIKFPIKKNCMTEVSQKKFINTNGIEGNHTYRLNNHDNHSYNKKQFENVINKNKADFKLNFHNTLKNEINGQLSPKRSLDIRFMKCNLI